LSSRNTDRGGEEVVAQRSHSGLHFDMAHRSFIITIQTALVGSITSKQLLIDVLGTDLD